MKFSWQANKKNLHCRGGGNGLSSEICQAPATGQRLLSLMAGLSTLLLVTCLAGSVALAAQGADQPQAVTTSNPTIAKAELELLLIPLSKEELLIEAAGWQEIVKAKAQEIARAQIAVLQENEQIAKAEEIREKTAAAKEQLEKVVEQIDAAAKSGDQDEVAAARQEAADAREDLQQVKETVEAAGQAPETQSDIAGETQRLLDETAAAAERAEQAVSDVQQMLDSADGETGEGVKAISDKIQAEAVAAAQAIDSVDVMVDETLDSAMQATDKAAALQNPAETVEQSEQVEEEE